ncbi:uncharacterized protein LOC101895351 [Musca domestica]|uniref:Uncharacterized protein LOC101895351 n=1 Tax=Musca domestica TaxID=7370 RepID=T1PG02_MUSDO|nr:uncharacterized protein LOC101895351 [Musca domestica]XP_011296380.2 uncharacterized protein LOC101895351 [Musca domestica]XP_019895640.2 uncharacterized protein LOC101895351 [Musca domestica]
MQYSSSRSENYSSSLRDSPPKWTSGKDHKTGYSYKTSAAYQYSNAGSGSGSYQDKPVDKNIDQLDALLEDLKNEREITRDRDHSMNYRTIERSANEDPLTGTITKTTKVIKTSKNVSGGLDDADLYPTSDYSTLRSNGTLVRNDYQTLEKPYVPSNLSPGGGFYETKHQTKVYESNRSLNKPEFVPAANSTAVSATTTTNATLLQEDLKNLTVSEDILPVPGTKVTTTVRTYTYEIPANAPLPTSNTLSRKIQYNTVQTNETNNVVQPHPVHAIPQTVVYNTESYSTLNKDNKPVVSNVNYEVREHYETNTLRNNTLPLQPRNQHPQSPALPSPSHPGEPVGSNTIVYNIHNTTTTTNTERPGYPPHSPGNQGPRSPGHGPPHHPQPHGPGPHGPTTHHYIYKESTNTVNTIHGGPPPHEPNHHSPNKPLGGYPPNGNVGYPPHNGGPNYPPANGHPPNTNITYNYSSTTTNTTRGGPNYGSPTTTVPFPVDGVVEYPVKNGNPPQRVEELMQSLGNTDATDRPDLNTPRKREIETAVATPNQQQIPSVNRAGRDIYYPPGHEMMLTKRSEMHASGSQAGGRWAKGSGMYEYESGSRSKTTTKSGGAMVPVCLPLCCAMPCSIM